MSMRAVATALALFTCAAQHASAAPLTVRDLVTFPFCDRLDAPGTLPPDRVAAAALSCQLHTDDITPEQAQAALGERDLALARDGDHLTVFARAHGDSAMLCCSLQTAMRRLGETDYWAARFRLADLDHATLTFMPPDALSSGRPVPREQLIAWRGPGAPAAPATVQPLQGRVTAQTLYSPALGETRRLRLYFPPGYTSDRRYPALFMGDGEGVDGYAAISEALVAQGKMRPILIVGALSGQEGIVEDRSALHIDDLRAADYLPDYAVGGSRFEQHLRFFCQELTDYAVRNLRVSRRRTDRAVAGWSNGGVLAMWAGLRCSEQFATAWPISGAPELRAGLSPPRQPVRFLISAGLYEAGFYYWSQRAQERLAALGQHVETHTYAAGHMLDQWELAFAEDMATTFSR